jgi:hypothetical protein
MIDRMIAHAKKGNMSKANRQGINEFIKKYGYTWRKEPRQMALMPDGEMTDIWVLRSRDGREIGNVIEALVEIKNSKG